jgi:hypothetical protein
MRTEQLNSWLTLAANLAVLAGIIFLAIEISQNTDMMRTQINQSRAELAMNEAESLYNSDYIPGLVTKIRQGDAVSAEERERYRHLFRAFNRNWDNQLRQYREGFLDGNIPRSVRSAVYTEIATIDLAIELWEQTKQSYSDEYIAFVDEILAEQ